MRKHLLDVAAGRAAPDLVLKNGLVLNVFTKQFVQGDVAIAGGLSLIHISFPPFETRTHRHQTDVCIL